MSDHTEERLSSRRRTGALPGLLALRPVGSRATTESTSLSRAGTLVLETGIPVFDEGSIYIPSGAEDELTYTILEAWWQATVSSQKDPKVNLYSLSMYFGRS